MKYLIVILCFLSTNVFAGAVDGGSLEATQVLDFMENLRQGEQLEAQVRNIRQQLERQTDMVKDMQTNTQRLSDSDWETVRASFLALAKNYREGQQLAYKSANNSSSYDEKMKMQQAYERNESTSTATSANINAWSKYNTSSTQSALSAIDMQAADLNNEHSTIKQLDRLGKTSRGRLQVMQVGNSIAIQQTQQMQKMRVLMMTANQMQVQKQESEQIEKDSSRIERSKWNKWSKPTRGNGKDY
ncbi:MAG: hypothetical protein EOP04_02485 [Proteobacteria bacterium]|nr:MAG: hypothetical protein EOP04_02485 [Pseudomonadota bacterium]